MPINYFRKFLFTNYIKKIAYVKNNTVLYTLYFLIYY